MLITAHALTGAFIGKEVGYPPLAFLLGLLSHFVLDVIPHCDGPDDKPGKNENQPDSPTQYALVSFDILVTIALLVYFIYHHQISQGFIWGAIGAILPDFIDNMPFWKREIRKITPFKQFHFFHTKIQNIKTSVWLGFLLQYSIAAVFFYLLLRSSH